MKKQQTFLIKIDDDQLRDFCSRLPLEETDQKIAFALATLSAPSGGVYAPARGVGQKELAKLAGVGVRTVKRRLTYLVRYGILSVERVNGKSNCYHFDLGMLLTAPAPTHNLYGYIKSKPSRETVKPIRKTNDRQRLLFDDVNQAAAAPTAQGECSLLSWMAGAVVQFTKRMFTSHSDECMLETGANAVKPGPTSQEPGPSSHNSDQNQCQTGANVSQSAGEPGPSGFFGAESPPEPGPNRGHPPQNRGQTSAKPGPSAPTLHQHNTSTGSGTLIKNHISHQHVDVDSDLDFFEGEAEA
ncbi:MAG: hypothetical protein KDA77_13470, partial [Planctomycetaceae bacterium]|nr:hypothetical protein [Planctomycetaceae bacterium]